MNGALVGILAKLGSFGSVILTALLLMSGRAIATYTTLAQIRQLPRLNRPSIPPVNLPQARNPIFPNHGSDTLSMSVPEPLQSLPTPPSPEPGNSDSLEGLEDFDYWVNLCRLLVDRQEYQKALSACDRAIILKPKALEIWVERTRIYWLSNSIPKRSPPLTESSNGSRNIPEFSPIAAPHYLL